MVEVVRTDDFDQWLRNLKDRVGRLRIVGDLRPVALPEMPAMPKPVGRGVWELRLRFGPGYRVYYLHDGPRVILLLCGATRRPNSAISSGPTNWPRTTGTRRAGTMARDSKYPRFDAADYLEDLDDVATYLEIALQESADDPTAIPGLWA